MPTFSGIGTMSGTSMDGLDLAYCTYQVDGDRYQFTVEKAATVAFEPRWKGRLDHLAFQSAEVFAKTHVYFGHWLGETIQAFIDEFQLKPDFVAMHGQTIFHQPDKTFTFQLGDGETVAAYLPCPLVSNFRNKDLALEGEGAPLVPLGEQLLFPDYSLFLNLGGISNLSYGSLAFDVSPCNGILNEVYHRAFLEAELPYDDRGQLAAQGQLDPGLLSALNRLPYYQRKPPKSLGREWTEAHMLPLVQEAGLAPEDALYTLSVHIAEQIASSVERLGAQGQTMLVTGGGGHHLFLMEQLQAALSSLDVSIAALSEEQSVWVDYKEAIIFGLLGLRTLLGQPTTLASVTGAKHDVVTGSIHLPPQGGQAFFRFT